MEYINHPVHSPVLNCKGERSKLYVITPIINGVRYKSRYDLYQNFKNMVHASDAILYTVEVAFGNRPFVVTRREDETNIQLRTNCELWHKENAINVAIQNLPDDWEYVAWVDADITFCRPDWVNETMHQLQHYDFIQMFSHAQDLDPNYNVIQSHKGFAYSYINSLSCTKDYSNWHPGFAWAARRQAIDDVGCLIDFAILGAADRHMAFALINKIEDTIPDDMAPQYKQELLMWQDRCNEFIKKNIGFMSGTINHSWHGKKTDRRYRDRWKILTENQYNPDTDLKKDWQGLWQLTNRSQKLRDSIRDYFRQRREDSIDV